MPNVFTRENAAILLIDHQEGPMRGVRTTPARLIETCAVALARTAAILDIPVVLSSNGEHTGHGPLLEALSEILPDAHADRIKRRGEINAWACPPFREAVRATGRRNLIIAAVTTDASLLFTAVDAVAEGHGVQAVLDACGAFSAVSEQAARSRLCAAGVTLTATETVIAELAVDWTTPEGAQLLFVVHAAKAASRET